MQGLKNKRILVAGAASGIGEATARRLASEGAKLFLGDINVEGVSKVAGEIGARWAKFDLIDPESIIALVATAKKERGRFGRWTADKPCVNNIRTTLN